MSKFLTRREQHDITARAIADLGFVLVEDGDVSGMADRTPTGVMRFQAMTLRDRDVSHIAALAAPDDPVPPEGRGVWQPMRVLPVEDGYSVRLYRLCASILGLPLKPQQRTAIARDLARAVGSLDGTDVDPIRPWNVAAIETDDGGRYRFDVAGFELPIYRKSREAYLDIPLDTATSKSGGADAYMFVYDMAYMHPLRWKDGALPDGMSNRCANIRSFALTVMSLPTLAGGWTLIRGLSATITARNFAATVTFGSHIETMVQRLYETNINLLPRWDWEGLLATDCDYERQDRAFEEVRSEFGLDREDVERELHDASNPYAAGYSAAVTLPTSLGDDLSRENLETEEYADSGNEGLSAAELEAAERRVRAFADSMLLNREPGRSVEDMETFVSSAFRADVELLGRTGDWSKIEEEVQRRCTGVEGPARAERETFWRATLFGYMFDSVQCFFYRGVVRDDKAAGDPDLEFLKAATLVPNCDYAEMQECLDAYTTMGEEGEDRETTRRRVERLKLLLERYPHDVLDWVVRRDWKRDPILDMEEAIKDDFVFSISAFAGSVARSDFSNLTLREAAELHMRDETYFTKIAQRTRNPYAFVNPDLDPGYPDDPMELILPKLPKECRTYPTLNWRIAPYWKPWSVEIPRKSFGARAISALTICFIAAGVGAALGIFMPYGLYLAVFGAGLGLAGTATFCMIAGWA